MEYEFTIVFELEHSAHNAVATKDRTRLFAQPHIITADTGRKLLDWLNTGESVPEPAPPWRAHAKAIEEAETEAQLKAAFAEAWRDAKLNDLDRKTIKTLYDGCKAGLAAIAAPSTNGTPGDPDSDPFASGELFPAGGLEDVKAKLANVK